MFIWFAYDPNCGAPMSLPFDPPAWLDLSLGWGGQPSPVSPRRRASKVGSRVRLACQKWRRQ